jgi:hypothetical protein
MEDRRVFLVEKYGKEYSPSALVTPGGGWELIHLIGTSEAFGGLLENPAKFDLRDCSPDVRELLTGVQKFFLFLGEQLQLFLKCNDLSYAARKYTGL